MEEDMVAQRRRVGMGDLEVGTEVRHRVSQEVSCSVKSPGRVWILMWMMCVSEGWFGGGASQPPAPVEVIQAPPKKKHGMGMGTAIAAGTPLSLLIFSGYLTTA